jgi:hypothetical protein
MSWFNKFVTFLIGEPKGERARDKKGRYVADDKSTKSVNEAYTDGRTPVKKAKRKTSTTKKRGRGRPKGSKNKAK